MDVHTHRQKTNRKVPSELKLAQVPSCSSASHSWVLSSLFCRLFRMRLIFKVFEGLLNNSQTGLHKCNTTTNSQHKHTTSHSKIITSGTEYVGEKYSCYKYNVMNVQNIFKKLTKWLVKSNHLQSSNSVVPLGGFWRKLELFFAFLRNLITLILS